MGRTTKTNRGKQLGTIGSNRRKGNGKRTVTKLTYITSEFIVDCSKDLYDSFFREQMKGTQRADAKTRAPMPKNFPVVFDFQFYPKRLFELLDKEILHHRKMIGKSKSFLFIQQIYYFFLRLESITPR